MAGEPQPALASGPDEPQPVLAAGPEFLAETASVHWRPRVDDDRLAYVGRLWTLTTAAHIVPFVGVAALLMVLNPLAVPVALAALAHAWVIPELYAQRGANVVRPRRRADAGPEQLALGLLGDLLDHDARALHATTGLVPEQGRLGVWLVGEAGALLLHGRRAYCYCVTVDARNAASKKLPSGDRIAHLLLALRCDEQGFATVANLSFAGARWRVRRRVAAPMRQAIDAVMDATDMRATGSR